MAATDASQVGATLEAKGEQTGNTKQPPHTESFWCLVLTQLCGRSRSTETVLTTFNGGLRRTERSCIQLGDVLSVMERIDGYRWTVA